MISASGQVLTANIVNINSSARGMVEKVNVKDNDKVNGGQKIAEIDLDLEGQQKASSAYSSYLSAKNSLDSAQVSLWTLDSAMWAANRKFVNDALARGLLNYDPTYIQENDEWLAAEAKYKNQQSVVSQAKSSVTNAWNSYQAVSPIIVSPIKGQITNLTLTEGMVINTTTDPSVRVAVIKAEGTPLISFNLSEVDVSKVKPGQKATITIDSVSGKSFTGRLMIVDRIGTVTSNVTNYPVVVKLDTDSNEILPNMSATANIILESKSDVLLVPSSAIQKQNGQSVVTIIKSGSQQTVNVETGIVSDTQTEIVSGLSEADIVIISTTMSTTANTTGRSVFSGQGTRMFMGR